ncbi:MAG TPA: 3-dehydroquinate synthase family protein [bacterium]|jgi:3-dehydroquinate synthase|nr:3-dehydroquinate synthase [bacterium]MDX9805468.1 3-dehydroquinate synthase family protein [bacterium]HOG42845.1 3-dehydroquinate synthase family protein [bacterium]HPA58098.1 3-dehydroquinate synthase family protein [bacterium]HPM47388.1 3-dehydroquinate synthase family protein [bacterium]
MEFDFSINYRTVISFRDDLADFTDEFGPESCFIVDKALKDLEKRIPRERIFRLNSEKEKDLSHVENCIEWLISMNAGRNTKLVAVGGGAVTDFGAFTASVFNRGMQLVLVPTTILAAVDSSIGGKTAVNFVAKNAIGTFYPANEVVVVKEFFKTLDKNMVASGKAEIVKIALIKSGKLFETVKSAGDLLSEESMKQAIKYKYDIIRYDLTDTLKKRMVLNWGHTFGHAIERYYGIPHGLAVASGMVLMQKYAAWLGLDAYPAGELEELLNMNGINSDVSRFLKEDKWRRFIVMDKKRILEDISMVYLKKVGSASIIKRNLNDILKDLEELK